MEYFRYTPLDPSQQEFRLLHVLPHPQSFGQYPASTVQPRDNTAISCLLENTSLGNCPKYIALSYAWGNTRLNGQIFVNGKLTAITASLEIALRNLQQERETLTLWVDALCINQEDTDEKNKQVQQMTDIYRNATQVIIWLGPAADESDKVIDCLDLIGREFHEHGLNGMTAYRLIDITRDQRDEDSALIRSSLMRVFEKLEYLFPDKFPSAQYAAFVHRGWWNRAWVIQELCVAQDPMFLCGKKRITFDNLSNAQCFLLCYGWFSMQRIRSADSLSNEETQRAHDKAQRLLDNNAAVVMLAFRRQYQEQQEQKDNRTLYSLLRTTCIVSNVTRIMSSDERDKVFALLGLASDKDELQIRVEYSKDYSAREVYIDTSRALLTNGYLELLSLRQVDKMHSTLPSWVCDWSTEIHLPFGDSTHVERPFAASGNSVPRVSVYAADGQHIAAIQGLQVDAIEMLGQACSDSISNGFDWNAADIFVSETERLCGDYSAEHVADILLGGLESYGLGDQSILLPRSGRVTAKSQEEFKFMKLWLRQFRQRERLNERLRENGKLTPELSAEFDKLNKDLDEISGDMLKVSSFWCGMSDSLHRRPFRSVKGYLGLAPAHAEPGDTICLLFGSQLPHVLHPALAGRYRLVGEAYVHGIMDGELIESAVSSTTFEIY